MSDQHEPHGSYYVPEHSAWPIIGAIGLFLLGLGSINLFSTGLTGPILFFIGAAILVIMFIGWMTTVVKESRAGLYDAQMNRTFRWGMIWFIFTDAMMFVAFFGALWYVRYFTLPWLSGTATILDSGLTHLILWPDFTATWPLLKNPNPGLFPGPQQGFGISGIPTLNLLIMISSAVTLSLAYIGVRHKQRLLLISGVLATLILGVLFLDLQSEEYRLALTHFAITFGSGIYGSIALMIMALHMLHVVVGLILLLAIIIRSSLGHFNTHHYFFIQATLWFWNLITIVWVIGFLSIYL